MKRHLTLAAAAAAMTAVPIAVATATEPKQPATPAQIVAYHDSGEWDADMAGVVKDAKKSLTTQLEKDPKKPAIVFDIDDTLESTYRCAKPGNFGSTASAICAAQNDEDVIPQTKSLYKLAVKKKVKVYFITGRPEGIRPGTADKLKKDGFKGTLLMTPNAQFGHGSASIAKTAHRKQIKKDGFTVLVNIGDQKSDLSGGLAVKRFKLPNPMFTTP